MAKDAKEKIVEISHGELVDMTAQETNLSKKDIDLALDGYEKSISNAINQVYENNEDVEEIRVLSKVSGFAVSAVDSPKVGKHLGITPLVRVNLFDSINERFNLSEESIENMQEEDTDTEKKTAKKAS